MGRWRDHLLLSLAALAPLSSAREITITSAFTTVVPTTAVVTSSSDIAGCTVASSMQITCGNGYYNTYEAVWQETCSASYSGGSLILASTGLSLRACASACAVRSACSAVVWDGRTCFLFQGDVTITPGGPYQAALRYSPSASPCVSTWLVTETDMVTSTGEVVYTVTQTPTPTPSSTPVQSPSSPSISPSSARVSSSSSSLVLPSSTPILSSLKPSSTPLIRPSTSTSSGTSSPASSPVRLSSTPLIRTSAPSSVPTASSSVIPSGSSSIPASSSPSFSQSPSVSSASSDESASASRLNVSATQPGASSTALTTTTVMPSGSSPSDLSLGESSGTTPSASMYTVTTTEVHTITSCAAAVTNCPAHQQTTYLTTETITYVTTVCPDSAQTTAPKATGSVTTIPSAIQTTGISSTQGTEAGASPQMTTSTVYVTEIDVVTACPPSVLNCPARAKSTYTTTKTVATYTTT